MVKMIIVFLLVLAAVAGTHFGISYLFKTGKIGNAIKVLLTVGIYATIASALLFLIVNIF